MKKDPKQPISWSGLESTDEDRPSLVHSLLARLDTHSPELGLGIRRYLEESNQSPQDRLPYDGTDSSVRLFLLLMEGLLTFEQLRYEIRDQISIKQKDGGLVPSHYLVAMSHLLSLEAELIQASKYSWEVHLAVWNAQAGPGDVVSEVDLSDARGRWAREDPDQAMKTDSESDP